MLKNFAKGLLVGSFIGGTAGLLFAPKSGKASRKSLVDEMDDATELTSNLTNSLQRFNHSLRDLKETATELLPVFVEETQEAVENYRFQTEPRLVELKKQTEKIQEQLLD